MIRFMVRRYASIAYRNKKSTLTANEESAADFVARNDALEQLSQSRNQHVYPLLNKLKTTTRFSGSCSSPSSSFSSVIRICDFHQRYANVQHGDDLHDRVCVQGRIAAVRRSGKRLMFVDLVQDMKKLQVMVNFGKIENNDEEIHRLLRKGDHISVSGKPWRTKTGELSVLATDNVEMAAPCLHPLPTNLRDETTRMHNRVVDMVVNSQLRNTIQVRSTTMAAIREFFNTRGFTEVNTPIISAQAGGAAATPFKTGSTALDSDGQMTELALRIAPELWLKRLVVGGIEKVYEIGPCFRNEGIDATHNPEFYTCEFYQSFASLDDLIAMTEQLLRMVVERAVAAHENAVDPLLQGMFSRPFKRLDFVSGVEAQTNVALPQELTVESLVSYFGKIGLQPETNDSSAAKLLDQLAAEYLETQCHDQPTIIMNHPQVMAPLAKSAKAVINGVERHVSRRFELFIHGKEYVNAYEEENSPSVQVQNFKLQGDGQVLDQGYVDALEWGLPPTGGWGLGIDRLVMLLTGSSRIDQVLPFGSVRTVNYQ